MRVRYWRGGELEREEVVEGPREAAGLPSVVARPFLMMAATQVLVEEPTMTADEYALCGAMQHSKAGVVCAEYVWRGYRLARLERVGRG